MTGRAPQWQEPDGTPIACRDKLEILNENYEELRHVMQDAFEDAVLMGVDEHQIRDAIEALTKTLKSPKKR
jgi:hypothetical protein